MSSSESVWFQGEALRFFPVRPSKRVFSLFQCKWWETSLEDFAIERFSCPSECQWADDDDDHYYYNDFMFAHFRANVNVETSEFRVNVTMMVSWIWQITWTDWIGPSIWEHINTTMLIVVGYSWRLPLLRDNLKYKSKNSTTFYLRRKKVEWRC